VPSTFAKIRGWLILLAIIGSANHVSASPNLSANEIISLHQQNCRYNSSLYFQSINEYSVESPFTKGMVKKAITKDDVWVRGDQLSATSQQTTFEDAKATLEDAVRCVVTENRFVSFRFKVNSPPKIVFTQAANNELIQSLYCEFMGGLSEYLPGSARSLSTMVRDSNSATMAGEEIVNNEACVIITSITNEGTCRLWLAKNKQFAMLRASLERSSDDLFNGKPLHEQRVSKLPGNELAKWVATVEDVNLNQFDGAYVPTSGIVRIRMQLAKGSVQIKTTRYTRSAMKINPVLPDKLIEPSEILDDTKVVDLDKQDEGIQYVWRGGRIVASIPLRQEDALNNAIASPTTSQLIETGRDTLGSRNRLLIALLSIAAVLVIIVYGARFALRSKQ
jgi:hypothetical protein